MVGQVPGSYDKTSTGLGHFWKIERCRSGYCTSDFVIIYSAWPGSGRTDCDLSFPKKRRLKNEESVFDISVRVLSSYLDGKRSFSRLYGGG